MAHEHVCPWWVGYILAHPLRRLVQNPEEIVGPFTRKGMTVLEIGPGRGFFSLPLARMVGPEGKIAAVDLQPCMLSGLKKRAEKAGLIDRIDCRLANTTSLRIDDLAETVDFTFAMAVVHEVPDKARLFEEIHAAMRPAGTLLMADPVSHFSQTAFEAAVAVAEEQGFIGRSGPKLWRSRSALLVRTC